MRVGLARKARRMGRALVLGMSALFLGLGLPLMFRRIPPNGWYGFRTSRSFESEASWFLWNQRSGTAIVAAAIVGAILGSVVLVRGEGSSDASRVAVLSICLLQVAGQLLVLAWSSRA